MLWGTAGTSTHVEANNSALLTINIDKCVLPVVKSIEVMAIKSPLNAQLLTS